MSYSRYTPRDQRRHVLALLADEPHGFTARQAAAQRGTAGDHWDADTLLLTMQSEGLVSYDPSTFKYTITSRGEAMRFSKKDPKNSTGAGANPTDINGDVLPNTPAPVASMEQQKEALIVAMEGPHAVALHAVRDDPTLHARLSLAVEQGLHPLDLSQVPRYRRPPLIEDTLNDWERGRLGGPCQICGTATARQGYNPRSLTELENTVPSFDDKGRCDFCREWLGHPHHDLDGLRHLVFMALVGLRSMNGGTAGMPIYSEVSHMPGVRAGEPWGFLTPALLQGVVRAHTLERWQFITTWRDSILHSFDNITAPVHTEATLPPVKATPPVFMERPDLDSVSRAFEHFRAKRDADRAERRRLREASFELVDAGRPSALDRFNTSKR